MAKVMSKSVLISYEELNSIIREYLETKGLIDSEWQIDEFNDCDMRGGYIVYIVLK